MDRVREAFCCVVLLAGWAGWVFAADGGAPLRVAVEVPYPPFAMLDKRGNAAGFDVDIARALCEELKRDCVIRPMSFSGIIPAIVAEEIDFAVAGIGATEERSRLVDFTERYYRSLSIYVARKGSVRSLFPDDLKGLRIGAQQDSAQEIHVRRNFKDVAEVVPVVSQEMALHMLADGRLDLALVDGLGGYAYLKTEAGAALETVGEPLSDDDSLKDARIAVSKKQPELRDALDQALMNLRRSGEYGRINRRYFNFNIY